jgi:hypothetical protein
VFAAAEVPPPTELEAVAPPPPLAPPALGPFPQPPPPPAYWFETPVLVAEAQELSVVAEPPAPPP